MQWREFEPEGRRESRLRCRKWKSEEARSRNTRDARVTAGDVDPIDEHHPDDLAEGERDDGEIVAAQAQHREAENDAPERRENAGDGQAYPEAPRRPEPRADHLGHEVFHDIIGREQRIRIGANGVERDVAEIEQPCEPDHDVESPAEHHVDEDLDAEVVDPLDRACRPDERQRQHRIGKEKNEPADRKAARRFRAHCHTGQDRHGRRPLRAARTPVREEQPDEARSKCGRNER